MSKGAMPIPYIIALIIGVIVIAILAYWLISSGGKGAGIGTEAECTARKTEFCITQTDNVWIKVVEKCSKEDDYLNGDGCNKYCSTIIPNWSALPTNAHCRKP